MRIKSRLMYATCMVVLLTGAVRATQDAWIPTRGAVPRHPGAVRVGNAPPDFLMSVVVMLKLRHGTGATKSDRPAAEESVQTVSAPSASDASNVEDYLRSQGFKNIQVAPNHLLVSAEGTVDIVQRAFHTTIGKFSAPDGVGIANETPPMVPSRLDQVDQIVGLDSFERLRTLTPR